MGQMLLVPFHAGRRVYGGLDLSSTTDMTSFASVQWTEERGFRVNWLFWIPEKRLEKQYTDAVNYRAWADQGFLRVTPEGRIKHDIVAKDVTEWCLEHDIGAIGYDPWSAAWIVQYLEVQGVRTFSMRQGYADLSEPSKLFESCVADGTLVHGGNPVARWHAENVEVMSDTNGNIRPVKPEAGSTKRIDGIVATIMAIAVAIEVPDDESPACPAGGLSL
jgi:phage terminase large subunit-like protein